MNDQNRPKVAVDRSIVAMVKCEQSGGCHCYGGHSLVCLELREKAVILRRFFLALFERFTNELH